MAEPVNLIQNLSNKDLDDLTKILILGLHPVIEKIIVAAEMPHIHANEGSNSGFLFLYLAQKRNRLAPPRSNYMTMPEILKFGL